MIHISSMDDLETIRDDPELYREVASHMLYCRHEMQEYGDDPDSQDFSFSVSQKGDPPMPMITGEIAKEAVFGMKF